MESSDFPAPCGTCAECRLESKIIQKFVLQRDFLSANAEHSANMYL